MGPRANIGKTFVKNFRASISDEAQANSILADYGIYEVLSDEELKFNILNFANDISYHLSAVAFAKAWGPQSSYLYHFNEPNAWEGEFKGHATHILDLASFFMNFQDKMTKEQAELGEHFAANIIKFVNGDAPWKCYKVGEGAMVYGPSSGGKGGFIEGKAEKLGRRDILENVKHQVGGLDTMLDVWRDYMIGGPPGRKQSSDTTDR